MHLRKATGSTEDGVVAFLHPHDVLEAAPVPSGRALGMLLFAYLALKWFNRRQDRDDDAPRGFLGLPIKPWVGWLVVIGGLALLMARSG